MKISFPPLDARRVAALAVTLVTVGFWLVIMTYPQFYIFNPLETKIAIFKFLQIFSTAGCILYAIFPLLFAWVPELNGKSTRVPYLVSVILWPVAIFVIQTTLAFQGGTFYAYVGRDPIFAFNDLIAPIFLLGVSNTLFAVSKSKKTKATKR